VHVSLVAPALIIMETGPAGAANRDAAAVATPGDGAAADRDSRPPLHAAGEHPKARFFFPERDPGDGGSGGGDGPAPLTDDDVAFLGDDDPSSLGVGASAARLLLDRLDLLEHERVGGPRGRRRWLLGLLLSLLAATLCGVAAIYLLAT
jgi:hypothetical protein